MLARSPTTRAGADDGECADLAAVAATFAPAIDDRRRMDAGRQRRERGCRIAATLAKIA